MDPKFSKINGINISLLFYSGIYQTISCICIDVEL